MILPRLFKNRLWRFRRRFFRGAGFHSDGKEPQLRDSPHRVLRHAKDLLGGILIVALVAVVVLIATSVFPSPQGAGARKAHADLLAIESSLKAYRGATGTFPATEQSLRALMEHPTMEPVPDNWIQILRSIPEDPWGNAYQYRLQGSEEYEIWSLGADGKPGTEDDISSLDE